MSADRNGATGADEFDDDDGDDDFPEMADLQLTFAQLLRKRLEAEQSDVSEEERVAVRNEVFKEQIRAAFLTHELASDADFERLWPRLRDDILCENAASVYLQVMDALAEELSDDA